LGFAGGNPAQDAAMTDRPRCAHPACLCTVAPGDAYCSEHCRKRVESPLSDQPEGCQCGHAACVAAQLPPAVRDQRSPK